MIHNILFQQQINHLCPIITHSRSIRSIVMTHCSTHYFDTKNSNLKKKIHDDVHHSKNVNFAINCAKI